jgi:hypothetical protein
MLLGMDPPYRPFVMDIVESSGVLQQPIVAAAGATARDVAAYADLRVRLAAAQGGSSRADAVVVSADQTAVDLDFSKDTTQWMIVRTPDRAPRELFLETSDCTPEITAFDAAASLPAEPLPLAVRYTATSASVSVNRPLALRVRAGNCVEHGAHIRLSYHEVRRTLSAAGAEAIAIPADSVTAISLTNTVAQPILIRTEPGFVYDVFAAPVEGVGGFADPKLLRTNPADPTIIVDQDDDGGWGLAAHLEPFPGTSEQRVVVARGVDSAPGNSGKGDVVVWVRRSPVPRYDLAVHPSLVVAKGAPTWVTVHLDAGRWHVSAVISAAESSKDVDGDAETQIEVLDSKSGDAVPAADDRAPGRGARRHSDADDNSGDGDIVIGSTGDYLVRIDSKEGSDSVSLTATPIRAHRKDARSVPRSQPGYAT